MMRLVVCVSSIVLVLSAGTFIVSSNVRWAANEPRLYNFLFDHNSVVEESGIPSEQLMRGANQIIDYFNNHEEELQVVIAVDGHDRQVYTVREILHMKDVKGLIQGTYRVQEASLLVFVVLSGLLFWRRRIRLIAKLWIAGGGLAISLMGLLGGAALISSFGPVFNLFHEISFNNDLWKLSSATYLVKMYPYGFWLDATLLIGAANIVGGVLLGNVGWFLLQRTRQRQVNKTEPSGTTL